MAWKYNIFTGTFDQVGHGDGSGQGPTGATGATGPTGPTGSTGSGSSSEPLSNGMLPNSELVFDDLSGDVIMSG